MSRTAPGDGLIGVDRDARVGERLETPGTALTHGLLISHQLSVSRGSRRYHPSRDHTIFYSLLDKYKFSGAGTLCPHPQRANARNVCERKRSSEVVDTHSEQLMLPWRTPCNWLASTYSNTTPRHSQTTMGSLNQQKARNRVRDAITQRIERGDQREEVLQTTVSKLLRAGKNSRELNRVAYEIAPNPTKLGLTAKPTDNNPNGLLSVANGHTDVRTTSFFHAKIAVSLLSRSETTSDSLKPGSTSHSVQQSNNNCRACSPSPPAVTQRKD